MKRWIAFFGLATTAVAALAGGEAPLRRVALFTSGVGYFERSMVVTGAASTRLAFPVDQVNDVLKSLIVLDEKGGHTRAVTVESREPVERVLETFRVDVRDNPDLFTLLNRLRGVEVRARMTGSDASGRILGVERRRQVVGEVEMDRLYLNLAGPDGLRSMPVDSLQSVRLADPTLQQEMEEALGLLAGSLDRSRKTLALTFDGADRRTIRLGYLIETPVWKTSYRLAIEDTKVYLQGWAHVENLTDEDWNDIALECVSGRPISFIQNLYDPFFVQRPVVAPEQYGAVAPAMHDRGVEREVAEHEADAFMAFSEASSGRALNAAPAPTMKRFAGRGRIDLQAGGGTAQARGEETGELFAYGIDHPVSIPRRQAAMIPIVGQSIEGEGVSVFNPALHPKHPYNAVALRNTSGLFLMRGPATVFEDNLYAGDGRMPDTPAGADALVSYALDLRCEVDRTEDARPETVTGLKIVDGVFRLQRKRVAVAHYTVANRRDRARAVLIEQPRKEGWNVVEPAEGVETAGDVLRFRLEAPAAGRVKLTVVEERITDQSVGLFDAPISSLQVFLDARELKPALKRALERVAAMKRELENTRAAVREIERRLGAIVAEQQRIRENMRAVDKASESFSRWERKLMAQEDEIERLRKELDERRQNEVKQEAQLRDEVSRLNVT